MKYINQLEFPHIPYITRTSMEGEEWEKGQNTTIKSSGCGLCASIMVADRLIPNCEFGLEDAIALSYNVGANAFIGTSEYVYVPAFAEKMGLTYEYTCEPAVPLCVWPAETGKAVLAFSLMSSIILL